MYVFTETINILIIEEHAIFLYSIHINQENTENIILGPKPPGPNRERTETSWGRTGKGPKPLAFTNGMSNTKYRNIRTRRSYVILSLLGFCHGAVLLCCHFSLCQLHRSVGHDGCKLTRTCERFPICDDKITENDRCVLKIINIHCIYWCPHLLIVMDCHDFL